VGAGYWGPNLARNFRASSDWELATICDLDPARAQRVADGLGGVPTTQDLDAVLADPTIDAVAIATPARTHHPIVLAALRAGKHVMVEKPLADDRANGLEMVREAQQRGLVLMADHTYCYTPAVLKIRELIQEGMLGDILFVDSVRINLGLIQPDVDVFWDLAPHDLSILDFVLPGGLDAATVAAHGADPLRTGKSCVGYLNLPLAGGAMAHINVNWLSPTKIRQMVIGGTRRTLVWDDLNPQQRLSVYDRGVDLALQSKGSADSTAPTSPIGWATPGRRPCRRRRPSAALSPSWPPRSGRAATPAPAERRACGCCRCWKPPRRACAARGHPPRSPPPIFPRSPNPPSRERTHEPS
jgi:predicted dehydrogenase